MSLHLEQGLSIELSCSLQGHAASARKHFVETVESVFRKEFSTQSTHNC